MGNLCYEVAVWIRDEHPGATTRDIQARFKLTPRKVSGIISSLQKRNRFITRWEPAVRAGPGVAFVPGKLYVDEIRDPCHVKHPWGGVTGTRVKPVGDAGDVIYFRSVQEAENVGGFCAMGIYSCLWGKSIAHAGYKWVAANQDTRKTS